MHVTFFRGGKHDAFPAAALEISDEWIWLQDQALHAAGVDKGCNGFVCFVRMKPGTALTLAELNLQRAKEDKPALRLEQLALGYRNYAHISEVTAIGIDYDEFPTEQPDWRPESWPCDVFAHSTHSYHPTEKPGKWRVILPLKTPIPIEREPAVRKALQRLLPRGCILRAPHQPAYLPTCAEGTCVRLELVQQTDIPPELDWTQLLDLSQPAEAPHATGEAAGTLLGAEFNARGLVHTDRGNKLDVICPWASEHVSGGDLGYLYVTEDGLGKYGCAHGACKGRGSPEVYELWNIGDFPDEPAKVSANSSPEAECFEPTKKAAPGLFDLMTAEDFAGEDRPIPWVVRDLISVGEPTLIVGGAGSGKTSAMVALGLAVASGQKVWGLFDVERSGPVVHIDYEQGKTLRRTYRAFAAGMGLDVAQLVAAGRLKVAPLPREQLLDANVTDKHLETVGKALVGLCRGAVLCIVNSLTAGTNKVSENDPKVAAAFNLFSRVSELTGCAFVVLHHTGRGFEARARGSSAIDGAVQTTWQIAHKRGQEHTTWTHTKDRPAGGWTPPFTLTWANDPPAQTLVASTVVDDTPLPGAETPEHRIEKAILFVMTNAGISGKCKILDRVRGKKGVKEEVFRDMTVRGLIENVGSRWLVAAGVLAPADAPDGVREEED